MTEILVDIAVPFIVALITALVTSRLERQKLEREYRLQYRAEDVARRLLSDDRFPKKQRSFTKIKHHLGGFDSDEEALRKILVQAGAVRFYGTDANGKKDPKKEYWALLENADLGQG